MSNDQQNRDYPARFEGHLKLLRHGIKSRTGGRLILNNDELIAAGLYLIKEEIDKDEPTDLILTVLAGVARWQKEKAVEDLNKWGSSEDAEA